MHPLNPAVVHRESRNPERGYHIVCYALNDEKGHMPFECFEALKRTKAWKAFMQRWRNQAQTDPQNRQALRALISQMTAVRSSKALPAIIGCEKAVGL